MSMPIPVGGKRGKEAVGAVETWAPDNSRAATEIAGSAPRTRAASQRRNCGTHAQLHTWLPVSPADPRPRCQGALLHGEAGLSHSAVSEDGACPSHLPPKGACPLMKGGGTDAPGVLLGSQGSCPPEGMGEAGAMDHSWLGVS